MPFDDSEDWKQREEDIRALKDQISGMGRSTAKTLIDEFGSLDELENASKDEVTAIDGIGRVMASRIGIWDENGEPVGSITRNPCPVCGEEYSKKIKNEYDVEQSIEVPDTDEVCLKVSHPHGGGIGSSPPTISKLFFH